MTGPLMLVMIEDDDGHARLIEKNLRRAGLNNPLHRFGDGGSALAWMIGEGKRYELLVLLDLNLPDMSGVEILAKVKADETLKAAPVIVLTTTDDQNEVNRCYELGCSVYITKPVSYDAFAEAIKRLGLFIQVVKAPELG